MLSLTRRIDESIVIFEGNRKIAEIIITGVRGRQVRLGLDAEKSITFLRGEVVDQPPKNKGDPSC